MSEIDQADIDAFNKRRDQLRARGIDPGADLYGQDAWTDETDPTGMQRYLKDKAAETAANIAQERAWGVIDRQGERH